MNNNTFRYSTYLFGIGMFLTVLFWFFGKDKFTMIRFINNASMVGLAYIVIGGFMFVYYGGFFRGIAFGFRNFFKGKGELEAKELTDSIDAHDRPTQKKAPLIEQLKSNKGGKRPPLNWAFIINALIFFLGSLLLSYIFYY
ncbi:MAG: DUF3899 domain-containing protein [Heyndrickxia sp.]